MGALVLYTDKPSSQKVKKVKKMVQRVVDVKYDHIKILKKLMELGENITARDIEGNSPPSPLLPSS